MRILNLITLVGVFHDAIKGVHAARHNAEMTATPNGVVVKRKTTVGNEVRVVTALVPWTNIVWAEVETEPAPKSKAAA